MSGNQHNKGIQEPLGIMLDLILLSKCYFTPSRMVNTYTLRVSILVEMIFLAEAQAKWHFGHILWRCFEGNVTLVGIS